MGGNPPNFTDQRTFCTCDHVSFLNVVSNGRVELSDIIGQWNQNLVYGHVVASNLIGPFQLHVHSCKQDMPTKLDGPREIHEIVPKPSWK